MREPRKISRNLQVITCWILCCQAVGYVTSESYSLTTPQPESDPPIQSCVYILDILDIGHPDTGLVDQVSLPSGSLLSSGATTRCASSLSSGTYTMDIHPLTQTLVVQLSETGSDPQDAFLPIPTICFGNEYIVATWTPGDIAYIALSNPNAQPITVTIRLGPQLDIADVLVDNQPITEAEGHVIEIPPGETSYVTSSVESLDGVVVSGTDHFGVLAGNTGTQVFGFGVESSFLEMFPPTSAFSDEYIVPLPPSTFHCAMKVVSLSEDSPVEVTLTDLVEGSPSTREVTNTLAQLGSSWTHTHSNTLHLQASGPVLVIQFKPESTLFHASSMTLIPPTTRWAWSAVLYPLTFSESGFDEHLAVVTIKTNDISGLVVLNLYDGTELTSSLTFTPFTDSAYSYTEISLDTSYMVLIQHTEYKTFQVIQYGSSASVEGLYSFPVTWNMTCEDETTPTSQTASLISDVFIYIFVSGLILLGATGGIIGATFIYFKNKRHHNRGILIQQYNKNANKHSSTIGQSIFDGQSKRMSDTSKRKDIKLPRVLHVKPLTQQV